jgi:SAM-dependent methyltransferase
MPEKPHNDLLNNQIDYYRARAQEYDEWFLRLGRYDRGPENNRHWFAEIATVRRALSIFRPDGDVLELACGTGIWTSLLLKHAAHITAVDASPEMLTLNRKRLHSDRISYVEADIFNWQPGRQFDVVFFAFWLSHVPPERFDSFWQIVTASLRPGGRFFFIDGRYETTSTAIDHHLTGEDSISASRRLNDGREFQIVKVFYQPASLVDRLCALGWSSSVKQTRHYFLYGLGHRLQD